MYYMIDYGDYEFPIDYQDVLDYAAEMVAEQFGINKSSARNIINEFDLLDTIFKDKAEEYKYRFEDDAREWYQEGLLNGEFF